MRFPIKMTTWLTAGLTAGLVMVFVGCGSPDQVLIEGRVTLDGQPVGPGSIVFLPETDGEATKFAAPIEDGQYRIGTERGAKPGTFRVEISWSKKTGRQLPSADPGIMMDEMQEAIPPLYNTQTTLVREIKPGENIHDFDLQLQ